MPMPITEAGPEPRNRRAQPALTALKMEEGAPRQGMQVASGNWERQENQSSPRAFRGKGSPFHTQVLDSRDPGQVSDLQNYTTINGRFKYGFPRCSVVKNQLAKARIAGDVGSTPGSGRSPGGGYGNPPQNSCLENPMDRGAWQATAHGVTKSWTWLSMQAPQCRNVLEQQERSNASTT